jgi:hypothetical protein
MKFFIPAAENEAQAEKVYQATKRFTEENSGPVSPARYYAIYYRHNGQDLQARIGEPEPLTGEMVIAIFRSGRTNGPFLICTPGRGVIRGDPVLANGGPTTRAIHFELE